MLMTLCRKCLHFNILIFLYFYQAFRFLFKIHILSVLAIIRTITVYALILKLFFGSCLCVWQYDFFERVKSWILR